MTPATVAGRVEIDLSVYNPFDVESVRDPYPSVERLLADYPVAFHKDLNAWLVSPHDLVAEILRDPRYSTRFADWKDAPAPKAEAEWNLYDKLQSLALPVVAPAEHMRLRRLTAPAFSRRVMDRIEERIRDAVVGIFDEIENPAEFNVATEIAAKVPIRAIARMVGVPPEAETLFEHGLGWNLVRAQNPMYAAQDRQRYIEGTLPGLQYLLDIVAERRAAAGVAGTDDADADFIGTLLATEIDGERLTDWEIVTLITALVTAGADTAVDLHTTVIRALLLHPDQRAILRARPELTEGAILEVLRWSGHGKFGGFPRFPLEDIEVGGQLLEKGSFVMPMFAPAWLDPAKWPEPRRFDVTRNHAGNIIFGAGPHLCIGLNLVKAQGRLVIEEFERRFGERAEIVGDVEYDPTHFNARRMTNLTVRTAA
ncbi:cytochrome P450 [Frankia sp. AgB1.9]|uniref:cytochrome P450 n=1 Tax=unclassified Frankia TaxID=2632575 RepID=UPI0019313FD9|nr:MULTISPECIES: cytochrome P450 [unclassified Frankia]MBL7488539.1 cytochrome P450 [Frankia sp. AgW1.1]MBL7550449.1 cytochrome P450 [Frankia sp. AgB1.9]MBL7620545.1 cytochrome P450 [Frankia sp. AgB1.8]